MTQPELFGLLTAAGLYPIPVEGDIDARDGGFRFAGDTAGFVAAAKALGAGCVFVASRALAAADFEHLADAAEGEPTPVDLATIRPALAAFKARVGEHGGHRLSVRADRADRASLDHVVRAPWWEEFEALRHEAVGAVAAEREAAWVKQEADAQRAREALLERLRGLIADPQFVQQPTQIAMQAYAVEQVPELEALGATVLKAEVQALDAKIKARGLRAKKP